MPVISFIIARLATVLILGTAQAAGAAASDIELANRYVPRGGVIENFQKPLQDGRSEAVPAVVSWQVDLSSGGAGIAFIYKRNGLLGLRVVTARALTSEKATFDAALPGTYPQTVEGAGARPIMIRRLLPNSAPLLMVGTSESASVGSYLDVFEMSGGVLRNLAGGPIGGSSFSIDCSGSEPCRLLAWGKWTDHGSATVQTWVWNGHSYAQSDADAERYAAQKLAELTSEATSGKKTPVFQRVAVARLAAEEYTGRREYEKALTVSMNVLALLEDRSMSLPRDSAPGKLTADIENGKAVLHDIMGRTYEVMARPSDASAQFRQAQQIRRTVGE